MTCFPYPMPIKKICKSKQRDNVSLQVLAQPEIKITVLDAFDVDCPLIATVLV